MYTFIDGINLINFQHTRSAVDYSFIPVMQLNFNESMKQASAGCLKGFYVRRIMRVSVDDMEIVGKEEERVAKILDEKMGEVAKNRLKRRFNVLQSFRKRDEL